MKINEQDRILVVAPHPDDDCIACGGLIALYSAQCDVLLVTDGYNPEAGNLEQSKVRYREFENAMKMAGVHHYEGLHIPEHQIEKRADELKKIDFIGYAYVFVPNRYEYHVDHVATYNAVKKQLHRQGSKALLVEYEVWSTIRFPNFYLDISSVIDKKEMLIREYKTQMENLDYVALALGLNSYRGKTKGMDYAEAFYCEQDAKASRIRSFKRRMKSLIKTAFLNKV